MTDDYVACIFQQGVYEMRPKTMTVQISSNGSGAVYIGGRGGTLCNMICASCAILVQFDIGMIVGEWVLTHISIYLFQLGHRRST